MFFNNVKRDKYNFQIFAIWYWRDVFRQYCWKIDFNVIKLNEFNCLFLQERGFYPLIVRESFDKENGSAKSTTIPRVGHGFETTNYLFWHAILAIDFKIYD